jgi:hypothetical protein
MKKIALLLIVFLLHVEADDTKVGTFDSGVSTVKIGKKQKMPLPSAKVEKVDVNDVEIEGLSRDDFNKSIDKNSTFEKVEKNKDENKTVQKEYIDLNQYDSNRTKYVVKKEYININELDKNSSKKFLKVKDINVSQKSTKTSNGKKKSDVKQMENGGVVLPYDKVDDNSGVVLPMDEKKEKGRFFSIFGF